MKCLQKLLKIFLSHANEELIQAKYTGIQKDGVLDISNYQSSGLFNQVNPILFVDANGEIRDKITAQLAVNAAITGHLVFSTLHANSASATVQRLMNMDVDPFLVTSALNLIVSQRLVRRICSHCKESFTPDAKTLEMVKTEMAAITHEGDLTFFKGKGCDKCKGKGYKGRVAIYELLEVTPEIAHVIIENKGVASEIEKVAVEQQGMVTIKQNGVLAALKGETTLEEVLIASDAM